MPKSVQSLKKKAENAAESDQAPPKGDALMAVSYKCPNTDCGVTLKTSNPVPAGKRVKCPKCEQMFAPVPAAPSEPPPAPGTFKFADDDGKKGRPKGGEPKPPTVPTPPPAKKPFEEEDEDAESVKKGYGVIGETQEERDQAADVKVKFGRVEDKYKKSARGPAIALLVMPSNLLTAEGLITAIAGLFIFVWGMWPLAFNDAPPGDEETEEAIFRMLLGCMTFLWGGLICFGASKMQELGSYLWATMGAVMGILPLLVGIFAIIMLQNPKVKAGFEESDAGVEEDEDDDPSKKKDDDDEDDYEDD
jgi:hypothetical protein